MFENPDGPTFLQYNAIETTAFCTAVLVSMYSLVHNPTGVQRATDGSEYNVYAGWRRAVTYIFLHFILMITVMVHLLVNRASARATWWVLILMVTPWAPIAGNVRATLTAWKKVRRMMLERVTRNELTAIIRDYFKFDQRSIAIPLVVFRVDGRLPTAPMAALRKNETLSPHIDSLREQAKLAADIDEPFALDLGILWNVSQSSQPSSIAGFDRFFRNISSRIDILASAWTESNIDVVVDPISQYEPKILSLTERARILDFVDALQMGGSVSDSLMTRLNNRAHFCKRCLSAMRATVEAYSESSVRGHTDMRAKDWLRHINVNWQGHFEKMLDIIWEACFMEQDASRVDFYVDDRSNSFGDRSKVTTTKTLAFLYLIVRSLMPVEGNATCLTLIGNLIVEGLNSQSWWEKYWARVAEYLTENSITHSSGKNDEFVGQRTPAIFKRALRDSVDADMMEILEILICNPTRGTLCGDSSCFLHQRTSMTFQRAL